MDLACSLATLALYDIVIDADGFGSMAFEKGSVSLRTMYMPLQGSCRQAPHANGASLQPGHSGSLRHCQLC